MVNVRFIEALLYYKTLIWLSGPSCSKLTTSLVNVSLNFQKLISETCRYCWLRKCEQASLIFSTKNFNVFGYKVAKHLTS